MKKSIAVLWLMSLLIASNALASNYHYDNYAFDAESEGKPSYFYFNLKDSYTLDPTNEYRSLVLCKSEGKYFCVKDGLFNFAVPIGPLKVGGNWTIDGREFAVKKEVELKLRGCSSFCVRLISQIDIFVQTAFEVN